MKPLSVPKVLEKVKLEGGFRKKIKVLKGCGYMSNTGRKGRGAAGLQAAGINQTQT